MGAPSLVGMIGAALAVACRPAHACEPAVLTPHTVDAASADRVPPTLTAAPVRVARSMRTQMGCDGSQTVNGCDDLAAVLVTPAGSDDQTPAAELGYRLRLMSGPLPSGLNLPSDDVRSLGGLLPLHFTDSDRAAAISFVLSVAAVDRAGNVSAPLSITVVDEGDGGRRDGGSGCTGDGGGSHGGGCTLAPASGLPVGTALFVALAVLLRRRRRPQPRR